MKRFLFLMGWMLLVTSQFLQAETTKDEARLFDFGRKAMRDGLDELAGAKFQQLLQEYPETSFKEEAVWLLARARLNQGRWEEALFTVESGLATVTDEWVDAYHYLRAEALLKAEEFDTAARVFDEMIRFYPKSRFVPDVRYGRGMALLGMNQYVEARKVFEDLQHKAPRELMLKTQLSLAMIDQLEKKYDDASVKLERLAKDEGKTVTGQEAELALAELDLARGRKEPAQKRLETMIEKNLPEAATVIARAHFRLGEMAAAAGNPENAAGSFEKAFRRSDDVAFRLKAVREMVKAALDPKWNQPDKMADKINSWAEDNERTPLGEMLRLQLAQLWQQAGRRDKALESYQNYFSRYPNGQLLDRAYYGLGWLHHSAKEYDPAIEAYEKAAQAARFPKLRMEARLKLGDLYLERNLFDTAASQYEQASLVKDAPILDAEKALYQAALSRVKGKQYAEALVLENRWETFRSEGAMGAEFLLLRAECQRKLGDVNRMIEAFQTLLKTYPRSALIPDAWITFAESLLASGHYKESIQQAEQFIEKHTKDVRVPRAKLVIGRAWERLEDWEKAVKTFEEIVASHPKTTSAAEALFWLGAYFDRIKNYARSQEKFELLIQQHPDHPLAPEAMYFAARAAYRLGQKKEDASRLIEKLVKDHPDSPWSFDARFLYADILSEQGKYAEALTLFEDLTKPPPQDKPQLVPEERVLEAQGRRGQCLRQLGKYPEALLAFQAVRDSPKADASMRHESSVEMGKTYENMENLTASLENYLAPLYGYTRTENEPVGLDRESYWVCKGALEAVRLLEQQKRWKEAAGILKRVARLPLPCRTQADEILTRIQTEHPGAIE